MESNCSPQFKLGPLFSLRLAQKAPRPSLVIWLPFIWQHLCTHTCRCPCHCLWWENGEVGANRFCSRLLWTELKQSSGAIVKLVQLGFWFWLFLYVRVFTVCLDVPQHLKNKWIRRLVNKTIPRHLLHCSLLLNCRQEKSQPARSAAEAV